MSVVKYCRNVINSLSLKTSVSPLNSFISAHDTSVQKKTVKPYSVNGRSGQEMRQSYLVLTYFNGSNTIKSGHSFLMDLFSHHDSHLAL